MFSLDSLFGKRSARDDARAQEYGIEVLAEGSNPVVDIVAVHGLNGHRRDSWTHEDGRLWLRDFLPRDVPGARVLSWGYDARTHSTAQLTSHTLEHHAHALLAELAQERQRDPRRPIIFVCHSLGGIVVKQALLASTGHDAAHIAAHQLIKPCTLGVLFFGTPHQGMERETVALAKQIAAAAAASSSHRRLAVNNALISDLARNSDWLGKQLDDFLGFQGDFATKFFYEEYPTEVDGKPVVVVPRWSAVLPGQRDAEAIVVHTNHQNMIKFDSPRNSSYRFARDAILDMLKTAPEKVSANMRGGDRTMVEHLLVSLPGVPTTAPSTPLSRRL